MNSHEVQFERGEELDLGYSRGALESPRKARLSSWMYSSHRQAYGFSEEDRGSIDTIPRRTFSELDSEAQGIFVHHMTGDAAIMDAALVSFLKIRDDLSRHHKISQSNEVEHLREEHPGFRLEMCYSLHVGWAIEGALGSPLKVDASYVSPHYSLAKRLTDVARRYQVQLVMSDSFVKHLGSHQLNAECRPLDVVVVSGIKQPITLYTYQPPEYPSFMDASSQRRFTGLLDAFDSC